MSAWSKVKAAAIDTESGAVNVAPLASTGVETSRKRVGLAVQLREREKGAWSMSEVERKKQDNEGARENWTRLMSQAYDPNVPTRVQASYRGMKGRRHVKEQIPISYTHLTLPTKA